MLQSESGEALNACRPSCNVFLPCLVICPNSSQYSQCYDVEFRQELQAKAFQTFQEILGVRVVDMRRLRRQIINLLQISVPSVDVSGERSSATNPLAKLASHYSVARGAKISNFEIIRETKWLHGGETQFIRYEFFGLPPLMSLNFKGGISRDETTQILTPVRH